MSLAVQAAADTEYPKATRPTLYFIGVTTGKSSIMSVFPRWAEHLGLGGAAIRGIDCKWHDRPEVYRRAVEHLRGDELSLGALVTTHKIDLLEACRDLFDDLDPCARLMGEVSCISKRDGRLIGHAKDPITSGLALEAFLPPGHWERTSGEALVLGAGGSSIAVTSFLMDPCHGANRPSRIVVTNRSTPRLEEIRRIHQRGEKGVRSILPERPFGCCAQNAPDPFFVERRGGDQRGEEGPADQGAQQVRGCWGSHGGRVSRGPRGTVPFSLRENWDSPRAARKLGQSPGKRLRGTRGRGTRGGSASWPRGHR